MRKVKLVEVKTKVRLSKAKVFELDPSKRYIIAFDNYQLTRESIGQLQDELSRMGVNGVAVVLKGNPEEHMKVIEMENNADATK